MRLYGEGNLWNTALDPSTAVKSPEATAQIGVGGQVGAWMIGESGEVGIAVPTDSSGVCIYAQFCAFTGLQFVLSASGAASLGQGYPTIGIQGLRRFYWFGGDGACGSVTAAVHNDGQVQVTRGIVRGGIGEGQGLHTWNVGRLRLA